MADPVPAPEPEADWGRAIGHALSGLDLGASGVPADAAAVVRWLGAQGWDAERLAAERLRCQQAQTPWPHHPPVDWVPGWGQYGALLAQTRRLAGLDGLHAEVHHGPKVLGPAERRLLADKPPHHL